MCYIENSLLIQIALVVTLCFAFMSVFLFLYERKLLQIDGINQLLQRSVAEKVLLAVLICCTIDTAVTKVANVSGHANSPQMTKSISSSSVVLNDLAATETDETVKGYSHASNPVIGVRFAGAEGLGYCALYVTVGSRGARTLPFERYPYEI